MIILTWIKNILNFKKPSVYIGGLAIVFVLAVAFILLANPQVNPLKDTNNPERQTTYDKQENSIRFSQYSGFEAKDVTEVRLDFVEKDGLNSMEIKEKVLVASLFKDLNNLDLASYPEEKKLPKPENGVYISLNGGSNGAFYYIDYTSGGIAKYAPTMSSYPNFTHRFSDAVAVKRVIKEFIGAKPQTLDQAVAKAVLRQSLSYGAGEVATEGHVILDKEEKGNEVKVYTISSVGAFAFENGIFTKISGSGSIPTVITFVKGEKGGFTLIEYKEPRDGADYFKSVRQMFPQTLMGKVEKANEYYPDLAKQQEAQAKAYLQSIGRDAKVTANHVEKKLADINVKASNELFSALAKYEPVGKYPYWLGTTEKVENGVRYIYETSQSETKDGYDLIIFRKTKTDGTLVEEFRYKIVGTEPRLLH